MTDLRRDEGDDVFREEVRAFITANLPPEMARRNGHSFHGLRSDTR